MPRSSRPIVSLCISGVPCQYQSGYSEDLDLSGQLDSLRAPGNQKDAARDTPPTCQQVTLVAKSGYVEPSYCFREGAVVLKRDQGRVLPFR